MIRTNWLPSALGPGGESDEAEERFDVKTEYRMTPTCPGFEVRIIGEIQNVMKAIAEWWETGSEEDDLEFIKWAVAESAPFNPEKEAALAELAEANKALNAAVDAETQAGRARLAAQDRLVAAREKAADYGIDG